MFEFVSLGLLALLVLPLPFLVLVGKCIDAGRTGASLRYAASAEQVQTAATRSTTVPGAVEAASAVTGTGPVPAQRRPTRPVRSVGRR